jgi:hypothetical protein
LDPQLFRTKSIDQLISDADQPERRLKKTLGWLSLTALGVGAIIGSGIFVLTGTAAAGETVQFPSLLKAPLLDVLLHGRHALGVSGRPGAGPAIAVSFFAVAVICGLAGLCYAELASMIPIAGSAYTYTYATLGELIAWIIGWDLILEYAVSNMAVSGGLFRARQSACWIGSAFTRACAGSLLLISRRDFAGSARKYFVRSRLAFRLQLAGFRHRDVADGAAGARDPRIGECANNVMVRNEDRSRSWCSCVSRRANTCIRRTGTPFAPNGMAGEY